MKINQLKSGIILSYAAQGVSILSALLYTPVMLRLLGQSEYGLYQLVYTVISYLGLLSFGFSTGYIRFYSQRRAKNDDLAIARLNGMFMIIFLVIAAVCILCGGIITVNSKLIFDNGLTDAELHTVKILSALMTFNLALSFINSVYSSYITAHEKFVFQKLVEFLRALFNPFLSLPLLLMGYGSVSLVCVSTFLSAAALLTNMVYCEKKLKMRFVFKNFDFGLLKDMWVFTFFVFINMIVDQFNWSVDKLLLGRLTGTSAVAVYSVAGNLNSMYLQFSCAVSGVYIPRVNGIVASSDDNTELTRLLTSVGRIQFFILALVISGYVVFGREFIALWAGEGYEASYRIGILLMVPVTVPLVQSLGIEIQRAKNMHKARSLVYLFIAVSNIFVSIPCIKRWGASGAAVGTAFSITLGNIIFMNIYYQKRIGLDMIYFWKNILKLLPALAAASVCAFAVKRLLPADKPLYLALGIVIYTAAYVLSMWFLGMNKE